MPALLPLDQRMSLSPDDIAALTGFSRDAVMAAMHRGDLRGKKRGRRYFATRDAVQEWLEAHPDA